jgi:hypothetical protein
MSYADLSEGGAGRLDERAAERFARGEPMTLYPEQVSAKEYLHRDAASRGPGSRARGCGLRRPGGPADGVTEAEARVRAIPGEWTIQEVVDHLIETHRPSLDELRDLLQNRRPAAGPIPASLQSVEPMGHRYGDLMSELKGLHAEALGVLSGAPDRLTDARAPLVMVMNVKEPDGREAPLHWIESSTGKPTPSPRFACTSSIISTRPRRS